MRGGRRLQEPGAFRIWGSGLSSFENLGLGFGVWCLGIEDWGLGVLWFKVWGLKFGVWDLGLRFWVLGLRVWGFGVLG